MIQMSLRASRTRSLSLRRKTIRRHLRQPVRVKVLGRDEGREVNLALARDINILPSAYFVGKRKPLSDVPMPWRWLIRLAYWRTGWASDYGLESQAICTSEEMADALIAEHPNWFKQELPINAPLPDETCTFKLMTFPKSEAANGYKKRLAPFVAVPARDLAGLRSVESKLDQLEERIEGTRARAV